MSKPTYRRRRKIIKPKLQWKLVGSFVGILLLGMLLQYLLLAQQLTHLAGQLPSDSSIMTAETPVLLGTILLVSFGILLPVTVVVGVVLTFRIAGPLYRFEKHLGAIARGENPGICRIRKSDELHELCGHINAAVETLREHGTRINPELSAIDEPRSETKLIRRAG